MVVRRGRPLKGFGGDSSSDSDDDAFVGSNAGYSNNLSLDIINVPTPYPVQNVIQTSSDFAGNFLSRSETSTPPFCSTLLSALSSTSFSLTPVL